MDEKPAPAPQAKPRRRWFRVTPDRCLVALLALVGFLFLSERFRWFAFNEKKGWTVLIAVASVGVALVLLALWFAASLVFHWRFQFSIRSLLALVVVVAIPCSWLRLELRRAEEQKRAVEAIQKLGGYVSHKWEFEDNGYPMQDFLVILDADFPPAPALLRRLLGNDFFTGVDGVVLDHTKYANQGSHLVAAAARLTPRAKFTDAGLEYVQCFIQLRKLDLCGTQVTDARLKLIEGLTRLKELHLSDTQITDAGLEHLKGLAQLEALSLDNTHVTGSGLAYLKDLSKLRRLYLDGAAVTDAGLENVKYFGHLDYLYVQNTKLTDAVVDHLTGLTQTSIICLVGTQVTEDGVKKLKLALPKCQIDR